MKLLGYSKYERMENAIRRAMVSCENAGNSCSEHFSPAPGKTNKAGRPLKEYYLTRFACYLTAMNGDPHKEQITSAQRYFAVKTREAEVVIPAAYEEIEILKLRVELVTMEREKAIAEQKLLDTRHYLTTALPKVVGDCILRIMEVKEIE